PGSRWAPRHAVEALVRSVVRAAGGDSGGGDPLSRHGRVPAVFAPFARSRRRDGARPGLASPPGAVRPAAPADVWRAVPLGTAPGRPVPCRVPLYRGRAA